MKRLARSVGVTDAALYNHFRSKREILEAVYEERGFYQAIDVLEHLSAVRPLGRQLILTALASADLWAQNSDFLRIVISEVLAGDRTAREIHGRIMERWHAGMRRLLNLYAAQGTLVPDEVERASDALVRLLLGTMVEKLLAEPAGNGALPFSQPEFRQELTDQVRLLSHSLLPAAPQFAAVAPSTPQRDIPAGCHAESDLPEGR
jgi:AcrR family transcriptional regulator